MSLPLLGHAWRAFRLRLLVVAAALALWGMLLPIVYDAFGAEISEILDSGLIPEQFLQFTEFGGGDLFSLAGSVSLGFIHPIAVGLGLVFAVGFAAQAIAGERQRGTLEVLLARPLSRRRVYVTMAVATALRTNSLGSLSALCSAGTTGCAPGPSLARARAAWARIVSLRFFRAMAKPVIAVGSGEPTSPNELIAASQTSGAGSPKAATSAGTAD